MDDEDAIIQFQSFENEDGTPLVEASPLCCIRPRPVAMSVDCEKLRPGVEIDVFKDDVWWEAVVVRAGADNVDVRLHSDGSIQKGLRYNALRDGLVFEHVWYERTNTMQFEKRQRDTMDCEGLTTVQCSHSQFDVEGGSTACCIISMLN